MSTVTVVPFPVDLVIAHRRDGSGTGTMFLDRLRGNSNGLDATGTAAEASFTTLTNNFNSNTADGIDIGGAAGGGRTWVTYNFKRAPGFMDIVCYTGNSTATYAKQTVSHSLGVPPELVIWKSRSSSYAWRVLTGFTATGYTTLMLNATEYAGSADYNQQVLVTSMPTSSSIQVGNINQSPPYALNMNELGVTNVLYLFATLAGVSKVGSYTGNGGSQTIACGFTTGARFVMIKRTDWSSVSDWYVWDNARGIAASATDPHLSLNSMAAEITTADSIDPANSGFIAKQNATTNINVTSATYIFLAIA